MQYISSAGRKVGKKGEKKKKKVEFVSIDYSVLGCEDKVDVTPYVPRSVCSCIRKRVWDLGGWRFWKIGDWRLNILKFDT